jgi:hypothetical protein
MGGRLFFKVEMGDGGVRGAPFPFRSKNPTETDPGAFAKSNFLIAFALIPQQPSLLKGSSEDNALNLNFFIVFSKRLKTEKSL